MTDVENLGRSQAARASALVRGSLRASQLKVIGEIISRPLLLWSTIVGIAIGVLPAIGGSAANMLAYDQAKKLSRHPERFGKGTPEGIIASEFRIDAYAVNNTMNGVDVLLIFGVLGYALVKTGFPLAPLILGLILGEQIELNLIGAIMTDDNLWLPITRPISGGLLLVAVISVALSIWRHMRHARRTATVEPDF